MKALVEAGVDLLAIETIPALQEAEAILSLATEFPGTKAWVTFSCKVIIQGIVTDTSRIKALVTFFIKGNRVIGLLVATQLPSMLAWVTFSCKVPMEYFYCH